MLKAETGDVHFSRVLSSSDLLESDLLVVLEDFPDLLEPPDLPDLPDFDLLNLTDFRDFLERWYLLDLPCL